MTLADNGFTVEFYAIDNGMKLIEYPNIHIHLLKVSSSKWSRPNRWRKLYQIAKTSDAKYYHIHDPELLLLYPRLKKRKKEAIMIYDMHENFPKDIERKAWIPKLIRNPLKKWVVLMEKYTLKYCDRVVLAEASYRDDYKYIPDSKLVDVYNFPTFIPRLNLIQEIRPFTMIYVGSITKERGIFVMLEMIHVLNLRSPGKYCLKLLGPINKPLQNEINEYLVKNSIQKYVDIYGRVPYPEIWEAYRSVDLGLCLLEDIPNHRNSMATKLYEYMAASLPILASDFPDWKKFVEQHKTGEVCAPKNIDSLIDIVEQRAQNKERYIAEGENGRNAYELYYNWRIEASKLLNDVYQIEREDKVDDASSKYESISS
ncbi:PEP-CTERM/exosortase A-associated glycosyltransferase, Daro_2409 family [Listeria fleischmannii subsp. fleischmannii]|uniref:PEP-CTERM/exosortase A-associated glycosyltransferase, Daro_2409 family n=3 Tax=Listeria fleischmannii TaxID=1069827 RepID=A0A2X3H779_9LIST|nr:PEP-CTERM/exosortase A-associated glycosyltransferase, Daro_2409 family [Listeria fleischmannii subsp. fleischmannii]